MTWRRIFFHYNEVTDWCATVRYYLSHGLVRIHVRYIKKKRKSRSGVREMEDLYECSCTLRKIFRGTQHILPLITVQMHFIVRPLVRVSYKREACIGVLEIQDIWHFTSRDIGYGYPPPPPPLYKPQKIRTCLSCK